MLWHYRAALPAAGWQVVEDQAGRLRAERAGMAFEVAVCGRGGVVWAGEVGIRGAERCHRSGEIVHTLTCRAGRPHLVRGSIHHGLV